MINLADLLNQSVILIQQGLHPPNSVIEGFQDLSTTLLCLSSESSPSFSGLEFAQWRSAIAKLCQLRWWRLWWWRRRKTLEASSSMLDSAGDGDECSSVAMWRWWFSRQRSSAGRRDRIVGGRQWRRSGRRRWNRYRRHLNLDQTWRFHVGQRRCCYQRRSPGTEAALPVDAFLMCLPSRCAIGRDEVWRMITAVIDQYQDLVYVWLRWVVAFLWRCGELV